ncbi:MAG: nuclease [Candidatus Methylumidiphilus alinenensis]|uniref:Nuclease n=1 Tax=Candidatus Methylumidiphilus alinenensis TaxID=2202197 RepID=A0A2W4QU84_9GAMM|nr:MAG: nuclease [Candidatus Methylumidiphilus alinenensis]
MPSIHILADDRENQSLVIEALRHHDGVEVTVSRLELGDYLLNNRLLFERKTMRDFAASLQDGRLFDQGIRLAASPLHKAIILEGNARDLASCGIGREALQGALITLTLFLGIPLLRAIDPQETAKLMLYADLQFDRIAGQAAPKLFAGKRPRGKRKTQQRILQSLPGIGPSTADKLLEHFGSVEAVLAADGPALQGVEGIGAVRAKAIRWAVEESWPVYRSNR